MRFTREKRLIEAYYTNEHKDVYKFLWFPMTIGGETRWLEYANIRYKVKQEKGFINDYYYYWEPWDFLNK